MVRANTVRRNIPLSRFFFLSDMFSPSPRHVLRYPFYAASCPRRILPSWITGLAGSLPAGFPVRKQKYNKKSRQAKRLRDQDLTNWATRIRTLKWRSQSPLPYHLAIAHQHKNPQDFQCSGWDLLWIWSQQTDLAGCEYQRIQAAFQSEILSGQFCGFNWFWFSGNPGNWRIEKERIFQPHEKSSLLLSLRFIRINSTGKIFLFLIYISI